LRARIRGWRREEGKNRKNNEDYEPDSEGQWIDPGPGGQREMRARIRGPMDRRPDPGGKRKLRTRNRGPLDKRSEPGGQR
jgi:hypothetical protein